MSSEASGRKRHVPVVKLSLAAVAVLALAAMAARGIDIRGYLDRGLALIRDAGPWLFFSAMAVLPALGVPLSFFTIPAGEAFGRSIGLDAVIALSLAMIAVNLAIGYALCRHLLRPLLARLVARYGYTVPTVTPDNALQIALLVRLTPGPPYLLQTAILGLAAVPFRLYMIVSWLAVLPWAVGAIILGKGLFAGNAAALIAGGGLIVVAIVAVQLIRRKLARREN